jgi:excisionase family DNA binding protein
MWAEINLNQQRGDIRNMQTDAEPPERNELRALATDKPPLMTPDEVATVLRVHRNWVYAHQQELPGLVRLGRYVRFRRVAIEEFLCEKFSCQ